MRVRIEDMDDHDRREVLRWIGSQHFEGRAVDEFLDACEVALEEEPVPAGRWRGDNTMSETEGGR